MTKSFLAARELLLKYRDDYDSAVREFRWPELPGIEPTPETARAILGFCKEKLAAYKRIRRIEFCELPKTISGKIRRVELRARERDRRASGQKGPGEFFLDDG